MIVEISEFEKCYSFDLQPVTQLCGQNISKKAYMLESLRKYFSTFKYNTEKNRWRDNVTIDHEVVGRKFFEVISVKSIDDILSVIKLSKQSLMTIYLKEVMQKFDWQIHLRNISEELEEMFAILNTSISQIGKLELNYDTLGVWDMVQKSSITTMNEEGMLEDQDYYELVSAFLNLIEGLLQYMPKRMLVLLENLDHLLSVSEYQVIIDKIEKLASQYNIYFVITTSLDGYVSVTTGLCPGIKVFNYADFQFPEEEKIIQFVQERYPYNRVFKKEDIRACLGKIVHKIGQKNYLSNVEDEVISKLINQSLMLNNQWNDDVKKPEIAFLMDENMV